MVLTAKSARKLARHYYILEEYDDEGWERLFNEIKGAAIQGGKKIIFHDVSPSYLKDSPEKNVERLKNLGYSAYYIKTCYDDDLDHALYDYFISWE